MQYQITLRDANQNFSHYIKEVESGNVIIITRHGKAIAKITPIREKKVLTEEQKKSRVLALSMMSKGLNLGLKGKKIDRDSIHER